MKNTIRPRKELTLAAVLAALCILIASCGGGGKSGGTTTSSATTNDATIAGKISITGMTDYSNVVVVAEIVENGVTARVAKMLDTAKQGGRVSAREALDASGVYTTTTDADGGFSLKVPEGDYSVSAYKQDTLAAQPQTISARAAAAVTVDFVLTATGKISGAVLLEGDVTGNQGIVVYIPGTSYAAYTNDAGSYTLSSVPVGTYSLSATSEGYGTLALADATVTAGQTTSVAQGALSERYNISSKVKWSYLTEGGRTVLGVNGNIYAKKNGTVGTIVALNSSGQVAWEYSCPTEIPNATVHNVNPVTDNLVLRCTAVSGGPNHFIFLSNSGSELWRDSLVNIDNNQANVVFDQTGNTYIQYTNAYDMNNTTNIAKYSSSGILLQTMALPNYKGWQCNSFVSHNGFIYINTTSTNYGSYVTKINQSDLSVVFSILSRQASIKVDNTGYYLAEEKHSLSDGSLLYSSAVAPTLITNETFYTFDGQIYDKTTGDFLSNTGISYGILSSDNVMYNTFNGISAFDMDRKTRKWTIKFPQGASPIALMPNRFYVLSSKTIYAIDTGSTAGLADVPWPTNGYDNQNSYSVF